jgi:predicted dehydrogenase
MPKKLRIGVVGLGRIGWGFHCKTLHGHPDWELAAVSDADPKRCEEARATYGCTPFSDFARLLTGAKLDAVALATPTHLHRPMSEAAFKAGLHVMLEKPMAQNVANAEAIARAATKARRVLTVYQPRRLEAGFQQLLHVVGSGRLGKAYHARIQLNGFARRNDWQSLLKYGGGMLNNYGAHTIDQLLQLIGYDIRRVYCRLGRVASLGDADDVVKLILESKSGMLGEIDINQASLEPGTEVEVTGSTGRVVCRGGFLESKWFKKSELPKSKLDRSLSSAGRKYPSTQVPVKEEKVPVDPSFAVDAYADFARAIRKGAKPFVKPEETLALMRLIARCRKDAGRIHESLI